MLTVRKEEQVSAEVPHSPVAVLKDTQSTKPSDVQQLMWFLQNMGSTVLDSLYAQLESMQEHFIGELCREVEARGIKLQQRLHLTLSENGELLIEGEEQESEAVQAILAEQPRLQRSFQEMARIALLAHGLGMACQAEDAIEKGNLGDNPALFSHFHAYLKGALSHFYVR